MSIDFIPINQNLNGATQAIALKNAISIGAQFYQQMSAIRNQMTHMEDGTTFTAIETYFGLPAGQGQTVFNLINGAVGVIEGSFQNNNIQTLIQSVA